MTKAVPIVVGMLLCVTLIIPAQQPAAGEPPAALTDVSIELCSALASLCVDLWYMLFSILYSICSIPEVFHISVTTILGAMLGAMLTLPCCGCGCLPGCFFGCGIGFATLGKSERTAEDAEIRFSQVCGIGHLIQDYYETVRANTQHSFWWNVIGSFLEGDQADADLAANLAAHTLGRRYWKMCEDAFVEGSGGVHSYEVAKKELEEILPFIGISPYDSSTKKIEKILAFIRRYIHYEYDINEVFLAPIETIARRSGDCDDFAILAAALFEYYGIESAIGFFLSSQGGHCMVLVHLNDLDSYGYYGFDDLSSMGLSEGRWIIIEPQGLIEEQGDAQISQWELYVASEIPN